MSGSTPIVVTSSEVVEQITPSHMGKLKISGVRHDKKEVTYMVDVSARRGVVAALCIVAGQRPVGIDLDDFPEAVSNKINEMIA